MGEPQDPFIKKENSQEILRKKMEDPSFLPTRAQIIEAFKMEGYTRIDSNEWNDFLDGPYRGHYEILTQEFIQRLSEYLSTRIEELSVKKNSPVIILEVGAGNGRLTYFLDQQLKKTESGKYEIIATDSGVWKIKPDFSVEGLEVQDALSKYNPDIVVSSWETHSSHDWTEYYEETPSVKEYILIETPREYKPTRKFTAQHLEEIEETQLNRHDHNIDNPNFASESKTMSFKKGEGIKIEFKPKE